MSIKYRPKVVHIEWIRVFIVDYIFLRFTQKMGAKVVYTAHNVLPHGDLKELQYDNYKKYYHEVDVIIVHTERTKKELIEKFQLDSRKIEVIPHGVNKVQVDEDRVLELEKKYVRDFKLKGNLVFSSLGTQAQYKGFDILKEVWIKTSQLANNDNVNLLIAGNMSNVDPTQLKRCKNVHIIDGALSDEEFIALTRISSVAVLPYISISQSGVLMTAMSEHVPVLVSDVGGLPDPINTCKVGWIMGAPSFTNLKEWMLYLLNNKDEIESVRSDDSAWDKVNLVFSWEACGSYTYGIYNRLINK